MFTAIGVLMVMAGCGLRAPSDTVKAATAAATRSGGGRGGAVAGSSNEALGAGSGDQSGTADASQASSGPTGVSSGPTTTAAGSSAPASGNGGATDVGVTGDTIVVGNVSDL